jgi:hypothetical protein
MKKILIAVFVLNLVFIYSFGQTTNAKQTGPQITWEKSTHDFGDMTQGDKVEQVFTFINTGNEPLIITNVEVTCGCTTPKGWPRDPVKPGDKGEILVSFNSQGKMGRQNKVVTVISNAINPEAGQIKFSANVLEKKNPNR